MKTAANLFAVTAFVLVSATFAAVGCTSAPVGTLPDSSSAASKTTTSGDDDDSTPAAATKTTTTTTPASSVTTTTTGTTTAAATGVTSAACTTCIGTNTQVKTYLTCDAACTDQTCDDQCWSQSGCSANETTCENTLNTCQTQCTAAATTTTGTTGTTGTTLNAQDQACVTCVQQGSAQAATYVRCSMQCNDGNCDDQCWSTSGCANNENTCESALDNCDQQCSGH